MPSWRGRGQLSLILPLPFQIVPLSLLTIRVGEVGFSRKLAYRMQAGSWRKAHRVTRTAERGKVSAYFIQLQICWSPRPGSTQ
jgi:hypothetical protein